MKDGYEAKVFHYSEFGMPKDMPRKTQFAMLEQAKMPRPDDHKILKQIGIATDIVNEGENPYCGLTYADGVVAALDWVMGRDSRTPH